MASKRQQLTGRDFDRAIKGVSLKLQYRREQKGDGTYASVHEALGILQEEMTEFEAEVHSKASRKLQVEELKDIAVGALWAIASIEADGIDW